MMPVAPVLNFLNDTHGTSFFVGTKFTKKIWILSIYLLLLIKK